MKSPAFNQVRSPLIDLQKRLDADYAKRYSAYQTALETWKADNVGDKPEAPPKREAFISDCTIERLAEILLHNPRGALLARDELSAWFNSFGKYKGKSGGSDAPNWLELWQAGVLKVDRKMAQPRDVFVPKAVCSITGTIQPGVLARCLSSDLFDAGAPFRLLFAMPPRRLKQLREIDLSEDAEAIWQTIVERLANIDFEETIDLAPDAKRLWIDHYNRGAAPSSTQADRCKPLSANWKPMPLGLL